MSLRFHKMHGAGNDFMLLDLRSKVQRLAAPAIDEARVRQWSDRQRAIGFDQLLVLDPAPEPGLAAAVRIWNADGSQAEQCGNGMRAIGLYLSRHAADGNGKGRFQVSAPRAVIALEHLGDDQVSVSMGRADFDPGAIPYSGPAAGRDGAFTLELEAQAVAFGLVSLGNPHAVIEVEDCERAPLDTLGEGLRAHDAFGESCNVGFAEVLGPGQIRLRVLERGAGETLACGSGACAAVAWLARQGRVGNRVRVAMGGGTLEVATERGVGPITLTGPATHVFEGIIA